MADVFISCELSGRELAERLAGTLEREGFSVARNLPPEESGIELEACKVAVVVWTADALASPHILADADNAREQGKLVNARAADVDPDRVGGRFHSKRAIARVDDAAIVAAVKEIASRGPQANAPSAAPEPARASPAAPAGGGAAAHTPRRLLFVSHVTEDRKAAFGIIHKLERRGVGCWVAPRDIQAGKAYDDEIVEAIESCPAMLLIFSERCNGNQYIRRELTLAGESQKLVIPLRIENAEPKGGLRARLVDLHRIDAFTDEDAAIAEVIDALAGLPGATLEPAAGEAPPQESYAALAAERDDKAAIEKKRALSRPWIFGGLGAAGIIAATVAVLAWMGFFAKPLPPVPEWTFEGKTFIGKPIPFAWKIDHQALGAWKKRFAGAEILYELQSAVDADFESGARTENYAENERKDIWRSNASRYWRVSAVAVDGRSRQPLPQSERAWSTVVEVTQYDSAYQRIATTGQVLVYVSRSDNQDIFKWLDNKGGYKGFDISLAKAVVDELSARMRTSGELAMVTRGVPWEDLLQAPSRGQADMIISSITKLARREPQYGILFSAPYFCTSYALIYRAGEQDRPIKEMVRDRIVGYQAKTTGEDVTTALRKGTPFKTREYGSTELIVKAVVASEIDFGITDTPFAEAAEVQYRADGKEVLAYKKFTAADLPPSIPPIQEYALAVPAGETELLGVINDLMRRMQERGKMTILFQAAAAEYERDYGLKRGSRTDPRQRPWECSP
jgi:ABC-type amino acid transport substrate-binding protein